MIGLALRLAVAGGREALVRLVAIAAAVAVGTGLLLTTLAGVHATDAQLTRYASMYPQETAGGSADPLLWSTRFDYFRGDQIVRIDVAATGPDAPTPIGVPRAPGPGEFYASPALRKLLATTPADQLADRYPGRDLGVVGPAALTSPDTLLVLVGGTPEQVRKLDQVRKVTRLDDNRAPLPRAAIDLILGVAAGGLLFPVLVFIGTATRLGAARREQRFAAMRLVGATPRQISAVAAVEAALAAAAGAAVGFAVFFAFRGQLAGIPFTGMPFFPRDMAIGAPEAVLVALGVPAGAAAAAWVALRRVRISPLGVSRRVTPRPPRVYRLIPLALGLAGLGFALVYRPPTSDGQTALFLPALLLVMVGLIAGGPWLTMVGARAMAARATRPAALIAARRLADNPAAGFRAVGGVMLALFVTTVAVGVMGTIAYERGPAPQGSLEAGRVSMVLTDDPPVPGTLVADLAAIPGVRNPVLVRENPVRGDGRDSGVIACADIPPAYGRCAAGASVAEVPPDLIPWRESASADRVWPPSPVEPAALPGLPAGSVAVEAADPAAVERVRTVLEAAFPTFFVAPNVPGDFEADFADTMRGWQRLADLVVVTGLVLAGCSLAVAVAAGLSERKRPFSLLRLSGAPVRLLRRVVALESAVPLLTVAVVAVGMGLVAAQLFLRAQMDYDLRLPGIGFAAVVVLGVLGCLAVIAATLPLLERITGPETARSE
ncbi:MULTISPECIES: ABC transporter permease [unclassified Micromonospora]|uniref:ABC transporter permease n=1 Tax=unclassified Micromonospora TaxID=2617518 RepID=UPI001890A429|nr:MULTISPECIES: ABC transporter permease [unclassified Micromonospora]MBF5030612.1 ABC transporter permease [Micromonospora sp. ANENR4]MCZ7477262.1 ABC transporter permease [Micromonospora sp. WMMC273]WBC02032.1 ABC transporter permease [Micromonospora sp. WMMA1976]